MQEELKREIEETFQTTTEHFSELKKEKINVVPFEGSWTAAQIIQHLILSCSGFLQIINGPESESGRDFDQNVAQTKKMFESPEKMKSPTAIEPENKEYDQERMIKKLHELKRGLKEAVEKNNLHKLATGFKFSEGYMTKFEAAKFLIYHTQRHTRQLLDVKRYLHDLA